MSSRHQGLFLALAMGTLLAACKRDEESTTVAASLLAKPAAETDGSEAAKTSAESICPNDDLKACFELAKRLEQGARGVALDRVGAAAAYGLACDRGHADACNSLGELTFFGNGPSEPDTAQGARRIEQACNLGSIRGCMNLGHLYAKGQGLSQDEGRASAAQQRALSLSLAACEGGQALSCSIAANIYSEGPLGIEKDAAKAASAYRVAAAHAKAGCDAEKAPDCALLAVFYSNGTGVPSDTAMAISLHRRACEAGELDACTDLGVKLAPPRGDAKADNGETLALYSKACDGNDARGCFLLALSHANEGPRKNVALAAALYEKACDRAYAAACVNLGRLHDEGEGGLPRNEALALALYKRGCNRGDSIGCKNLGIARREHDQDEFRKNLKIGDVSHCGLVTEVNGPIVRLQSMIGMYWMKLDQVYPAGQQRCSFYNGLYQDPG